MTNRSDIIGSLLGSGAIASAMIFAFTVLLFACGVGWTFPALYCLSWPPLLVATHVFAIAAIVKCPGGGRVCGAVGLSVFWGSILFGMLLVSILDPWGPSAFNYNTKGVNPENLYGAYVADENSQQWLGQNGYTNSSGSFVVSRDGALVFHDIPDIWHFDPAGSYESVTGRWTIAQNQAVFAIKANFPVNTNKPRYTVCDFNIVNECPPHVIQLVIDHNRGFQIRYKHVSGQDANLR